MSHFVSNRADFDDLNAQLLQRNTESSEQDEDVEALEEALHRANTEGGDGDESRDSVHDTGDWEGESRASGSGTLRPGVHYPEPMPSVSRSASPRTGPRTSQTGANLPMTPFARSRKNSEDDLAGSARRRTGNRDRKLSDPDTSARPSKPASPLSGHYDSAPPSRPPSANAYSSGRREGASTSRQREERNVTFGEDAVDSSPHSQSFGEAKQPGNGTAHLGNAGTQHHLHGFHHHHPHHHHHHDARRENLDDQMRARHDLGQSRPAGHMAFPPRKLGTWDGVFMPVSLNILGIILFLRFGFILGQVGLLGSLLLLTASYAIDMLTAMSVSAISTNGQVRGGGAYYLISRSLGPEFGGSIGIVFFVGQALNAAMNVLGFVESLTDAFGESREGFLPEGPWWNFSYGSVCLLLSTLVCLVGSRLFAKATLALAVVLAAAIISIPVSSLFVQPFIDSERGAYYTGWSLYTLRENLFPHFTSGAAGSSTGAYKENWQTVFGVLFPAVTGLLAGVSMSGDLRKPSKSIPKGTNWSLIFTYGVYVMAFLVFAGTIARESFYVDVGIVSDVALSPELISFGVLASTAFSALMGVMACGKVLQAIARDDLLPILETFAQGTESADTPVYAVFATWVFCQAVLFVDSVNIIAQLVTMTSLLTFGTLSFATLALKAGGAPSFRPSFQYWNIWTAGAGTVATFGAMFFTAPLAASACIVFAIFLFSAIHIFCPPKPWGDVTRNLNYHIVRKYLLRLDERKGRVTHWRPQILLLANNARTDWNLIIFCNSLKKGALYVLGHVLKGEFSECLGELRRQQIAWLKLVDVSGIKSFVDVIIARDEREGARNLILSCGLGGMRPNIVCLGFPTHLPKVPVGKTISAATVDQKKEDSEITIRPGEEADSERDHHQVINVRMLPTDIARRETPILPSTFVGIMEDTLALQKALALAYGFENMSLSGPSARYRAKPADEADNVYIDLWPIQIQSPDADASHAWDTYTMVLQLGTILSMTGSWKHHKLRVSVFVEHEEDVEEERRRVRSLLDNLRVPASLRVFALSSEHVSTYHCIVRGKEPVPDHVKRVLAGDPWWDALRTLRREHERRQQEAAAAAAASASRKMQSMPSNVPSPKGGDSRKQSKREQRMMGVSLPKEHLDFFKRNMRIGLAHPKASKTRRSSESHAAARPFGFSNDDSESEYSGSDSDSESDLSDELARLDLDDIDWMSSSASSGLRRSRTVAGGQQQSVRRRAKQPRRQRSDGWSTLPDEPGWSSHRAPLLQRQFSGGTASSYGSLSSTPRPSTFQQSQAPTASPIRENVQEGGVQDDTDGTLRASDRARARRHLQQQHQEMLHGNLFDSSDPFSVTSSAATHGRAKGASKGRKSGNEHPAHVRSRSDDLAAADRQSTGTGRGTGAATLQQNAPVPPPAGADDTFAMVSFNSLPNKAQYLILNELIRVNSSESTSVVLTSLPAPEAGTSQDAHRSLRYLEQLESLFGGGPPVLGVHAKQLTMTSAL